MVPFCSPAKSKCSVGDLIDLGTADKEGPISYEQVCKSTYNLHHLICLGKIAYSGIYVDDHVCEDQKM